jgi:uncharacterized protein (TIGR03067 family)
MKQFLQNMALALIIVLYSISILIYGHSKSHASAIATKKPDLDFLQGTWKMRLGFRRQGMPSFTFNSTNMEYHGAIPQVWYKATFTLQEDMYPKRLEAVLTDCPHPKQVGGTFHAIYKIEDDGLTLTAFGPEDSSWPSNFDAGGMFVFLHK